MLNLFRLRWDSSEAGFLTGLLDHEHTEDKLHPLADDLVLESTSRSVDQSGRKSKPGKQANWSLEAREYHAAYRHKPEETKLAFRSRFFRTGDIGYQDAKRDTSTFGIA